jgi:hypothetical protein
MEVTRHNFRSKLEEVEEAIDSCSFLSIDGEFTGRTKNKNKNWPPVSSMAKPGCLSRIRDRSRVIKFPDPQQRILQIFSQKTVTKLSEVGSGMNIPRSRIRIFPIPDPVV